MPPSLLLVVYQEAAMSTPERFSEPLVIVGLRQSLRRAFEKNKADRDPCATIVAPPGSMRKLGIRPRLLADDEMGRRVYSLNVGQTRKLLANWDAHKEHALAGVSTEEEQ